MTKVDDQHTTETLLVVGLPGPMHVGGHLQRAAEATGLHVSLCDVHRAFSGPVWLRQINWRFRGRRPTRLGEFSEHVVATCATIRPTWLLATGFAPIDAPALDAIGRMGTERLNYLTDDPWNRVHRSSWFLESLPDYDRVFTPRLSNIEDLRRHGCRDVVYVPFAYAPEIHYPPTGGADEERDKSGSDVLFVGGADADRVPLLSALADAGFSLSLYGNFWPRHSKLRRFAKGLADPDTVRQATSTARIALCLVRRANRDGHVMRSFEIPAIGACTLAEDTREHRAIFGEDGQAVVYFRTQQEMVDKAGWLLSQPEERMRLARAAHSLIVNGRHTYRDRLTTMLGVDQRGAQEANEVLST